MTVLYTIYVSMIELSRKKKSSPNIPQQKFHFENEKIGKLKKAFSTKILLSAKWKQKHRFPKNVLTLGINEMVLFDLHIFLLLSFACSHVYWAPV